MKINCEYCKKEFDKPNFLIKKSKRHFCSRKCGCLNATKLRWKNHTLLYNSCKCSKCGNYRHYKCKSTLCQRCYSENITEKNKNFTMGDIKKKHQKRKNSWYSAEIRNYARIWNSHLNNTPCQKCGYYNHTEFCHIKPISQYDNETKLKIINDDSNLLILCPNHHWEFDNGFLQLKDIPQRKEIPINSDYTKVC